MEHRRWGDDRGHDREIIQRDIAEALDQPSSMLIWLVPALGMWAAALIAMLWLYF